MVDVIKVKSKKQQKEFLNFPLNLYKDNPYFVPPLYMDEKKIFDKNYVYYETSEAVYFNAYIDGKMVGRISAILQHASNDKWNQKRVRFTRFDSIDDQNVANALFDAVENYAKEKGMEEIVGPLGFSDLEREGLLIEGFDQLSTFEEQYNFDYYQRLIENCGYKKDVDWLEHKLYLKEESNERLKKYTELVMKRFNLRLVNEKSTNQFIKKYGDNFFEIIDEAYDHLYGTVPMTEETKRNTLDNLNLVLNNKFIIVVCDASEKVIAFGLLLPGIGKALQKSGGRMTLPTIIKLLKVINKPEVLDMALIGVLPEYQGLGVNAIMMSLLQDTVEKYNIKYLETNLNLETNNNVMGQWKYFKHEQHKRRRAFIKNISIKE